MVSPKGKDDEPCSLVSSMPTSPGSFQLILDRAVSHAVLGWTCKAYQNSGSHSIAQHLPWLRGSLSFVLSLPFHRDGVKTWRSSSGLLCDCGHVTPFCSSSRKNLESHGMKEDPWRLLEVASGLGAMIFCLFVLPSLLWTVI